MKKATITFLLAAAPVLSLAGDWGKAPVDKAPIEECVDLGGRISAGYETDYIFHGVRFARDSVWTDVNYTLLLLLGIPFSAPFAHSEPRAGVGGGSAGF